MSQASEKRKTVGTKRPAPSSATVAATSPSQQQQQQHASGSAMSARIISGSVGSLVTALAVTPLEVAKVHFQNVKPSSATISTSSSIPRHITPCPKGCGVFVLNNGLFDCILPKCRVPYFDQFGNLKEVCTSTTSAATTAAAAPTKLKPKAALASTRPNVGTFSVIRNIFVKDGFRGIYAGLAPTLIMGVPSTALYYAVYDELVAHARTEQAHNLLPAALDPYVPLLAGSSARLLTTLGTAPLELVRTRQASMVGEGLAANGMMEEFRSLIRTGGWSSLYKGLGPTLWRDVPFSGIYWLSLEQFRGLFAPWVIPERESPTPLQLAGITFLSGASAGMVAAACTTPFDVVKTRQSVAKAVENGAAPQTLAYDPCCNHGGHVVYQAESTATAGRSSSVFAHMRSIYETEGMHGLWRGNQTRMIKVAPSCAIMITCYELGKRMLNPSHAS